MASSHLPVWPSGVADFLAGRRQESSPEEFLAVIHRLVHLLSREYQEGIAGNGGRELEAPGKY